MAGTVAGFDTPVAINKQNYDLILAQLQKRGLENQTAKMMAYDILIITEITGQNYKEVIKEQVGVTGLNLTTEFIDQLNILRSATNKLGLEDTATPNVHVSRAIV